MIPVGLLIPQVIKCAFGAHGEKQLAVRDGFMVAVCTSCDRTVRRFDPVEKVGGSD